MCDLCEDSVIGDGSVGDSLKSQVEGLRSRDEVFLDIRMKLENGIGVSLRLTGEAEDVYLLARGLRNYMEGAGHAVRTCNG